MVWLGSTGGASKLCNDTGVVSSYFSSWDHLPFLGRFQCGVSIKLLFKESIQKFSMQWALIINAAPKKENVILNLIEASLEGTHLLNESMVQEQAGCVKSAHQADEFLNNRLVDGLFHVTEHEPVVRADALGCGDMFG